MGTEKEKKEVVRETSLRRKYTKPAIEEDEEFETFSLVCGSNGCTEWPFET